MAGAASGVKRKACRRNREGTQRALAGSAFGAGAVCILMFFTLSAGCVSPQKDSRGQPGLRVEAISAFGAGERLTIRLQGSAAVLDVVSPGGIGRARLLTSGRGWPRRVLVRLHLQALEGFEAWNGSRRFFHALRHEENVRRHQQQQEGVALEPIVVELPAELLQGNPSWVQIQWVDWYRG